eukprot:TRINITY_DN3451_c0_g1_i1.p1 TRINITY_DN3451_c0_g1~~TRINITY_DN3451_c0_g1_i1.p1  ORF type:complete len:1075 (+),score=267.03 TRINITY_DN3451_c0_g1_i1:38-3226(+)
MTVECCDRCYLPFVLTEDVRGPHCPECRAYEDNRVNTCNKCYLPFIGYSWDLRCDACKEAVARPIVVCPDCFIPFEDNNHRGHCQVCYEPIRLCAGCDVKFEPWEDRMVCEQCLEDQGAGFECCEVCALRSNHYHPLVRRSAKENPAVGKMRDPLPVPQELVTFYLVSRNTVLLADEEPLLPEQQTPELLARATQVAMNVSGVNPNTLAAYPLMLTKLEHLLCRKMRVVDHAYMHDLVDCLQQARIQKAAQKHTLSDFVDNLLASGKLDDTQLAQRILNLVREIEDCAICFTNRSDTFFQCGHRVCGTCAAVLTKCPFCRTSIVTKLAEMKKKARELAPEGGRCAPSTKPRLPKLCVVPIEKTTELIRSRLAGLMKRTGTLDSATTTELDVLCHHCGAEVVAATRGAIHAKKLRSEELTCYLGGRLFWHLVLGRKHAHRDWSADEKDVAALVKPLLHTPSRLIRFLSAMAIDQPVKDQKVKGFKFSRAMRRWVANVINTFPDPAAAEAEVTQRRGFWAWLFTVLHIGERQFAGLATARHLCDVVRRKARPVPPPAAELNRLYAARDPALLDFLAARPGLAFRNARCTMARLAGLGEVPLLEWLRRVLPAMKPAQLMELLHIFRSVPQLAKRPAVYRGKTGQLFWPPPPDNINQAAKDAKKAKAKCCCDSDAAALLSPALLERATALILEALAATRLRCGCLVVNRTFDAAGGAPLERLRLLRGRPPRVPDWVPVSAATGDVYTLQRNRQVVLFIHWLNGPKQRVDLDLSVICVGEDDKMIGKVDFTNLEQFGIRHSGDLTNAPPPSGASEYITFAPEAVDPAVRKLYVLVFSYSGIDFDDMGEAFVGIGYRDEAKKGLGPNGSHVVAGCELHGAARMNFTSTFDFATGQLAFLATNINRRGETLSSWSVGGCSSQLRTVSRRFDRWLESRSPPTFGETANALILCTNRVHLLLPPPPNSVQSFVVARFCKRDGETPAHFQARVLAGADTDNDDPAVIAEPGEQAKDKEQEKKGPRIFYFGDAGWLTEEAVRDWPRGSVVVAKSDPRCGASITFTSDPYSLFI